MLSLNLDLPVLFTELDSQGLIKEINPAENKFNQPDYAYPVCNKFLNTTAALNTMISWFIRAGVDTYKKEMIGFDMSLHRLHKSVFCRVWVGEDEEWLEPVTFNFNLEKELIYISYRPEYINNRRFITEIEQLNAFSETHRKTREVNPLFEPEQHKNSRGKYSQFTIKIKDLMTYGLVEYTTLLLLNR